MLSPLLLQAHDQGEQSCRTPSTAARRGPNQVVLEEVLGSSQVTKSGDPWSLGTRRTFLPTPLGADLLRRWVLLQIAEVPGSESLATQLGSRPFKGPSTKCLPYP